MQLRAINHTSAVFENTRLSAIKIKTDLSKTFGENDFLYRMGNRMKVVETDKRRFSGTRTMDNKNFWRKDKEIDDA